MGGFRFGPERVLERYGLSKRASDDTLVKFVGWRSPNSRFGVGMNSDPCYTCPNCGATDVRASVQTLSGTYCQCPKCRHVWHVNVEPPTPKRKSPGRRKTDR